MLVLLLLTLLVLPTFVGTVVGFGAWGVALAYRLAQQAVVNIAQPPHPWIHLAVSKHDVRILTPQCSPPVPSGLERRTRKRSMARHEHQCAV